MKIYTKYFVYSADLSKQTEEKYYFNNKSIIFLSCVQLGIRKITPILSI